MIWSIVSNNDFFAQADAVRSSAENSLRSSNPYDYVRCGYFLDKASMFGGKDFVDYNSDISGDRAGVNLYFSLV